MNQILLDRKKILRIIFAFIVFLSTFSLIYWLFISNNLSNNKTTIESYTPNNKVIIVGGDIFYKYLINSDADKTISMIEQSVLYNTSISNNSEFTQEYKNLHLIENRELNYYKQGKSYYVIVNKDDLHFDEKTPRDYWLNFKTDDGRSFKLESNGSVIENKNGAMILINVIKN